MSIPLSIAIGTVLLGGVLPVRVQQPAPAAPALSNRAERIPQQPYSRYSTTDRFGRQITYYVSEPGSETRGVPLVVYVQGSGCQSNFVKINGAVRSQNGHATIADEVRGRARLVIVEKPGVAYLDAAKQPGSAEGASAEFLREHTLERWSEAVGAAMTAARRLPGVDGSKVLVLGHSEGGLVACRVAAENGCVTHVASLAGGGPTQLFDLVELARSGQFTSDPSGSPEARAGQMLEGWAEVCGDPSSTERFWLGHPYRRWSSFLADSPMQELPKTGARIFLAQGTADKAVCVASFDALRAQLAAQGRDVTVVRVEGAGHSFDTEGERPGEGWRRVTAAVIDWFLAPAAAVQGDAAQHAGSTAGH